VPWAVGRVRTLYNERSFCSDVNAAKRIFKDVFDHGTLTGTSPAEMRDADYIMPI
jgi:hypothetical protein